MSHVAGAFTGLVRDSLANAFTADAQDYPGVDHNDGLYRANLRRSQCVANASALATGVMTSVALYLQEGDVVENLTFVSATTAAGTPTNCWFALYGPDNNLLGQSADQEDDAWAANTAKTLPLAAPVTAASSGVYRAAVMVAASTPPTLVGVALHNAVASAALVAGESVLAGRSGSSLTATAPATVGSLTANAAVPLVIAT